MGTAPCSGTAPKHLAFALQDVPIRFVKFSTWTYTSNCREKNENHAQCLGFLWKIRYYHDQLKVHIQVFAELILQLNHRCSKFATVARSCPKSWSFSSYVMWHRKFQNQSHSRAFWHHSVFGLLQYWIVGNHTGHRTDFHQFVPVRTNLFSQVVLTHLPNQNLIHSFENGPCALYIPRTAWCPRPHHRPHTWWHVCKRQSIARWSPSAIQRSWWGLCSWSKLKPILFPRKNALDKFPAAQTYPKTANLRHIVDMCFFLISNAAPPKLRAGWSSYIQHIQEKREANDDFDHCWRSFLVTTKLYDTPCKHETFCLFTRKHCETHSHISKSVQVCFSQQQYKFPVHRLPSTMPLLQKSLPWMVEHN